MNKICSKCKKEKPIDDFCKHYMGKNGLRPTCRSCNKKISKIYRQKNKERMRIYAKIYRENHNPICYEPVCGINKTCKKCKKEKPIEKFYPNKYCRDGRRGICQTCQNKYSRKLERINSKKYIDVIPSTTTKICSKCKVEKPVEDFYKRKGRRSGLCPQCKNCYSEKRKTLWRTNESHRLKLIKNHKQYIKSHKKEQSKKRREYNILYRPKRNKDLSQRRKTDPEFKVLGLLRGRVLSAVKLQCTTKAHKTAELIGCSVPYLIKYLESQFDNKMTWKNHGLKGWHIHHIKPCAAFDLTKPEEQKRCFHYTNMCPLWGTDNLKKSSWYKGKLYRKNILPSN